MEQLRAPTIRQEAIVENVTVSKRKRTEIIVLAVLFATIFILIAIEILTLTLTGTDKTSIVKRGKPIWCIQKDYHFNMDTINYDWLVADDRFPEESLTVFKDMNNYTNSEKTVFIRNDNLVIRAFLKNGTYHRAQLWSTVAYTPSMYNGRKIRYEIRARVPTIAGACPSVKLHGDAAMYGADPLNGNIGIIEWRHVFDDNHVASLVWNNGSENIILKTFPLLRDDMSSQFHNYIVELSNQPYDGTYVRFGRNKNGEISENQTVSSDEWMWSHFPPCRNEYDAYSDRCSLLAPFDNTMHIYIGFHSIGGGLCGIGIDDHDYSDYDALERGVEMEISRIVVSALYFDKCDYTSNT